MTRDATQIIRDVMNRGYATKDEADYLRQEGLMQDVQSPLKPKQKKKMKELADNASKEYRNKIAGMKHYLIVTSSAPGCPDEYRAPCGHTSTNPKEFTAISNPSSAGVTCEKCIEKLRGAVVIVNGKVTE